MAICPVRITNPTKVFTPVFTRLWNARERFVVNYGGTGSSKSFSAAQKEVLIACQKTVNTLVVRKVNGTLKKSVIKSFRRRIAEFGLTQFFKYNKTDQIITNTVTGSEFIFTGLDDPEKLKSIEGINRIFVEEASELDIEDMLELNRRVRGVSDIQITINFNPIHETHWLKGYFFDTNLPNCKIIKSTYKDNPFLTDEDRAQIEWLKEFNYNQYRVYALGEWGLTENKNPWLFSFSDDKHIKPDLPFLADYPVYLAFDFNNAPFACTAWQHNESKGDNRVSFIHCIKEFSGKLKVDEMCNQILAYFPNSILYVTGDRSGQNDDLGRNETLYEMIAAHLGISRKQLILNSTNLEHADSRMFINAMLHDYPNIYFSRKGCPNLIDQCFQATVDLRVSAKPQALLKNREEHKNDEFDSMRYYFQTFFHAYAKNKYYKMLNKK